jgi:hypothetical protein
VKETAGEHLAQQRNRELLDKDGPISTVEPSTSGGITSVLSILVVRDLAPVS